MFEIFRQLRGTVRGELGNARDKNLKFSVALKTFGFFWLETKINSKIRVGVNMTRFDELAGKLNNVDEAKKGFVLSLLSDFVYLEEQIEKLRTFPRYIINKDNPKQQKKLPVHDILKDMQAQKNDIATKILRTLDGEVGEESALVKALKQFNE